MNLPFLCTNQIHVHVIHYARAARRLKESKSMKLVESDRQMFPNSRQ